MYRDEYHPKVKKDLKKIARHIQKTIKDIHIPAILANPTIGEALIADLAGIRAYHFRVANLGYRIAYVVSEEEKRVYILMIGKRESFYDILKRRI